MTKHLVRVTVTVDPSEDAVNSVELLRSYNPQRPKQVRWKPVSSKSVNDDGVAVFKVASAARKVTPARPGLAARLGARLRAYGERRRQHYRGRRSPLKTHKKKK